jgi:ketosteroid isomerase-like protein
MRRSFLIIGLLTAAVSPVVAQTKAAATRVDVRVFNHRVTQGKPADQSTEQAVLQLTRDWLAAEERKDTATLQRIIADDFQGYAPGGHTVFKEDVIPLEGTQSGGLAITTSEMKARLFGDTAVVTARGVSKAGEKGELRVTVVFAKRNARWQMVAAHLSAVPSQ